jgi:hypothetical protein
MVERLHLAADDAFVTANASYDPSDTLLLQANAYFRGFWQAHVDGNNTQAQFCNPGPPLLCFGDPTTPLDGAGGVTVPAGATLGEIDRTWTRTSSYGGSAQATSTSKVIDRPNHFVIARASTAVMRNSMPTANSERSTRIFSSLAQGFSSISQRATSRP